MSNISKEITQEQLNTVLEGLQQILKIKNTLNVDDTGNDYCVLSFELEWVKNVKTDNEFIISTPFKINITNPVFSILDYYVILRYYKLDADMDLYDTSELIEMEVKLNDGENIISFEEYPVYLQADFDLLIKKESG